MRKYEYVTININKFMGAKIDNDRHREIIDNYARRGYRFVGYIPTNIAEHGKIKELDLIFELDI